tara:strand:- start:219 stop:440 length:222 start_codon:yes stop_codon:yes gene_type:complete
MIIINDMGHMNWISTLNESDIEEMKQIVTNARANEIDIDKLGNVKFQDSSYSVAYLEAVIKVWETNVIDPDLL